MASLGPLQRNAWRISAGAADLTQRVPPPRPVTLPAAPRRVTFDLARSCIIVVDVQNESCQDATLLNIRRIFGCHFRSSDLIEALAP